MSEGGVLHIPIHNREYPPGINLSCDPIPYPGITSSGPQALMSVT